VHLGIYRRILIVSSEICSIVRNYDEPESAALLGDGAAAALVEGAPHGSDSGMIAWQMSTWPGGAALTEVRGGGSRKHPNFPNTTAEDNLFAMDGPAIYKMARKKGVRFLKSLFNKAKLKISDIDLVVPHQASGEAIAAIARYGFHIDKIVNIIEEYGNCAGASMPMALAYANKNGVISDGDIVMLCGTGAGLSMAAAIIEW
jgi:3-oxoacyl-[acyl-carrier-protein] synthase-3